MAEVATVSCSPQQGAYTLLDTTTQERIARVLPYYATPQERELAIANLRWMSVLAPTHVMQMDFRLLWLAMRNEQSFGSIGKARVP